jgi:hypothetical protein
MPDPDRTPRSRWQSDAYRSNARDSRFAYRWNPDRFEDRYGDYRGDFSDRIQPRDRYESYGRPDHDYGRASADYHFDRGYERGYYDRDRAYENRGYENRGNDNREFSRDDLRDYERSRGRGRVIDSDFDRSYDLGPPETRDRGTAYDSPRDYERTFDRGWDRRPDGERIGSEYGWSHGNRAREWEHDRRFDERGLRRRW